MNWAKSAMGMMIRMMTVPATDILFFMNVRKILCQFRMSVDNLYYLI